MYLRNRQLKSLKKKEEKSITSIIFSTYRFVIGNDNDDERSTGEN